MTFQELIDSKSYNELDSINYFDYLRCDEWKNKRHLILQRDNFRCTKCGKTYTLKLYSGKNVIYKFKDNSPNPDNENINLQVHHTLYIFNRLPWQYDNEDLVTLCNYCHENLHNNEHVKVWDEHKLNIIKFGACDRCIGKGYIKEYRKIQGGICFKCRGFGYTIPLINIKEIIKNYRQ